MFPLSTRGPCPSYTDPNDFRLFGVTSTRIAPIPSLSQTSEGPSSSTGDHWIYDTSTLSDDVFGGPLTDDFIEDYNKGLIYEQQRNALRWKITKCLMMFTRMTKEISRVQCPSSLHVDDWQEIRDLPTQFIIQIISPDKVHITLSSKFESLCHSIVVKGKSSAFTVTSKRAHLFDKGRIQLLWRESPVFLPSKYQPLPGEKTSMYFTLPSHFVDFLDKRKENPKVQEVLIHMLFKRTLRGFLGVDQARRLVSSGIGDTQHNCPAKIRPMCSLENAIKLAWMSLYT